MSILDVAASKSMVFRSVMNGEKASTGIDGLRPASNPPPPKKKGMAIVEQRGERDYQIGKRFSECPYSQKASKTAWQNGWLKMHHEKMQMKITLKV